MHGDASMPYTLESYDMSDMYPLSFIFISVLNYIAEWMEILSDM